MVGTPTIEVASIGIPDTLFLMLLALVVFGPRRLPEIGRQIGKLMYEFRKVSNDFKYQMEEELRASEEADRQKKLNTAASLSASYPAQPDSIYPPVMALEAAPTPAEAVEPSAVAEAEPVGPEPATELAPEPPAEASRGEARRFPNIQPPISGDLVEAARPFRGRVAEEPAPATEPVAESKAESGQESGQESGVDHA